MGLLVEEMFALLAITEGQMEYGYLCWILASLKDFLLMQGLKTVTKAEYLAGAFGGYELNAARNFTKRDNEKH